MLDQRGQRPIAHRQTVASHRWWTVFVVLAPLATSCADACPPAAGAPEAGPTPARAAEADPPEPPRDAGEVPEAPEAPAALDAAPSQADGGEPDAAIATPLRRLWAAADQMLSGGDPAVWGREGRLGPEHLTCEYTSRGIDGLEAFNVLDSDGYQGDLKCNLFAFEMAYRAGLQVPLVGRGRGWGYPGPEAVVDHLAEGGVIGQWARPVRRPDLESLNRELERGAAFLLVGAGRPGSAGHMGVVDQVHELELASTGVIQRIEYSGWEAGSRAAGYARRTWRIGRYSEIHLVQLRDPPEGEPRVVPLGFGPLGASVADAERHQPDGGVDEACCRRGRGLPELPVAHEILDERSSWGPMVDVKRVVRGQ